MAASRLTPLPDKPEVTELGSDDKIVVVADGRVKLASKETVSAPFILDEDTEDEYKAELVKRNGHLCVDLTKVVSG